MTTVYKFKAYFTDSGVGTVQDPAPTCTVINMADDSKLADAQATTASTNMPGLYSYEYSGADGLDAIRRIVRDAPAHRHADGWLLLEHGWEQGAAVCALLVEAGFAAVETARDLEGRDRVTFGRRRD